MLRCLFNNNFIAVFLIIFLLPFKLNAQVPKNIIDQAPFGVVEVIIPKVEDKNIKYDQPLPMNKIPFRQRSDRFHSIGTAFFVSKDRLISAAHVFDLHERKMILQFSVRTMDNQVFKVSKITKYSQYRDIIEFELEKYPARIIPFSLRNTFNIGENVCAPGNAIGEGISFRCGGQIASTSPEELEGAWDEIRFSTPVSPGNSGGPLLDERGAVIGIVVKRSSNENLNVAMPISEYQKLPVDKAEFFMPDLRIRENTGLSTKETYRYQYPLPQTPRVINHEAYRSLNEFYLELINKHKDKHRGKLFPDHEMFRIYLMAQNIPTNYFALVSTKDQNMMNWGLDTGEISNMRIGIDQELIVQNILKNVYLVVEKPKDQKLKQFINNPEKILSIIALNLGFNRRFRDDDIKVLSFGPPEKNDTFRDGLGRVWMNYTWFTHYENSFINLYCSPIPKGVACSLTGGEISRYNPFQILMEKDGLDESLFGYYGSYENWREFFELGQQYLPHTFQKNKVLRSNGKLMINLDDLAFSVRMTEDTSGENTDSLEARVGYSPFDRLKLTVQTVNYTPQVGLTEGIEVMKIYKSDPFQSPRYRQKIERMFNSMPPYDGKVYTDGNIHYLRRLLKPFNGKMAVTLACTVPSYDLASKTQTYCNGVETNALSDIP